MRSLHVAPSFGALHVLLLLLSAACYNVEVAQAQTICTSDTHEFHMRVNLHAGE
jgi:hypothetical protein